MNKEKMIVVEKSTKWWLSVVATGSLVVGLLGGYTFGSLTQKATNQQSTVQASKTQQNNQEGGSNSKKKPANADGSTKDKESNSNQNNEENATKS